LVSALKLAEKLSAMFANHVIIANDLWLEKYTERSASKEKCSVFINNVDSKVFHPLSVTKAVGKRVVIFPGGLQWHQGLDIAVRAFAKLHERLPDTEFHIYGDGDMKPKLVELVSELGLDQSVRFFKPMPIREIAKVMAAADLGVVPKRADSFGNEAYSTKIMEFMSVGVPVIISSTKIDRFYFNDSVVKFFESGNVDALAAGMVELLENQSLRASLIANANEYVLKNSWESRKQDYLRLVDSLCA
jgi:glycosyltransferase involved in cell wall biosynthesis